MARITYTGIIASINGSIGGTTFQTNKSGAIVRLRPKSNKSYTNKQSQKNSAFAGLSFQWGKLSLAQKTLWNEFALINPKINKLGTAKNLTGYNYFQSLNFWLVTLANPILSVPPAYDLPNSITGYDIILGVGGISLSSVVGALGAEYSLAIYATTVTQTLSRSNFNKARLIKVIPSNTGLPLDLTNEWESTFGIDYSDSRNNAQFNISFMILQVRNDSGITSVGNFTTFSF